MKKKTVSELWEDIFFDYEILVKLQKNLVYQINADQIRKYKEPRLMTKFDTSESRPRIFKENNLGILPVRNGEYVIGRFSMYNEIPKQDSNHKSVLMPSYIKTIDPDSIYSEANALHVASITGMLEDFVGENITQTISGRMRASGFSFSIKSSDGGKDPLIEIDGPQIEIDGGYEGPNCVYLVEAKNYHGENFIIRQLYYPYRFWQDKLEKEVVPIFFTYDSGVYTLFKYSFSDKLNYSSIVLDKKESYIVEYSGSKERIDAMISSIGTATGVEQEGIPFPQADSFTRVIDMLSMFMESNLSSKEVAEAFSFDVRQGNYYIAAGRYLGLLEEDGNIKYRLTPVARELLSSSVQSRNLGFAKQILQHKVFQSAYQKLANNELNRDFVISILCKEIGLSIETARRRSSTVVSWCKWIRNSNM